ncbi:hypothetical protein Cni_G23197 [Canna indica]|uniref:VOC domain-containing protein n=1 Tax=Canna indica TaxID=4628 RepID=A0AAQ3KZL9_9LILI|nr:hypothetical protein Cni_G23197 [Canna indica]
MADAAAAADVVFLGFKPLLVVPGMKVDAALQFYKSAFGAEELRRVVHPKRKAEQENPLILSADLKIGSSILIVSDIVDDSGEAGPIGGGISFRLEVDDADAAMKKAISAGALIVTEVAEEEGGVAGKVKDPFGVTWVIAAISKKTSESEA